MKKQFLLSEIVPVEFWKTTLLTVENTQNQGFERLIFLERYDIIAGIEETKVVIA